jgi:hypothetical protein
MRRSVLATLLLLTSATAWAVDGVIEINHARALAGGVTPGDTPGYPVTLSQSGSYRLTGNLTQPDANTDVIQVANTVRHVTVDLNGFEIVGSNTCIYTAAPASVTCAASGLGSGIATNWNETYLSVHNGAIRGMGLNGISGGGWLTARNLVVEHNGGWGVANAALISHVRAYRNFRSLSGANGEISHSQAIENGAGIDCSASCVITHNVVKSNVGNGISSTTSAYGGAVIAHNVSSDNSAHGILVHVGQVVGNTCNGNDGVGLYMDNASGRRTTYANNVFHGNNLGGNQISSSDGNTSYNLGGNLCQDALCP